MYAMDKGYSYSDIEITDSENYLTYNRRDGVEIYFLSHYTKNRTGKFNSNHRTSNVRILPLWYNHIKNLGFRLNDTREFQGSYVKEYIKGLTHIPIEEFRIYIQDDWLEIHYCENYGIK